MLKVLLALALEDFMLEEAGSQADLIQTISLTNSLVEDLVVPDLVLVLQVTWEETLSVT